MDASYCNVKMYRDTMLDVLCLPNGETLSAPPDTRSDRAGPPGGEHRLYKPCSRDSRGESITDASLAA